MPPMRLQKRCYETGEQRQGQKIMIEKNTIYFGDCLELLKHPFEVDAVITDPPYNISKELTIRRDSNQMKYKGKDINYNFGQWDKFDSPGAYLKFTYQWLDLVSEKIKPGGTLIAFFDRNLINFPSMRLINRHGYKLRDYYAFCKSNPVPQARQVKWVNGWEMAGVWQKIDRRNTFNYLQGQNNDYDIVPICSGKERTPHPTQKPLFIIEKFIRCWTKTADVILDPFVGSGTTAEAALRNGRFFIGIEKDKNSFDIAQKRIQGIGNQLRLI